MRPLPRSPRRAAALTAVVAPLLLAPGAGWAQEEAPPEPPPALDGSGAPAVSGEETRLADARSIPDDSLQLVDRVAAVVGDTVLLLTDVLEAIVELRAQNPRMEVPPPGTPAFDSLVTATARDMVDRMVVLQRAKRSDVVVTRDELDQETEARFREIRNQFPSAVEFQQAVERSGRNLFQFRERLRSRVEAELLVNRYIQQNRDRLPPVSVSDQEIERYYEANLAGASRPATIAFEQLILEPEASQAAEDSALAVTEQALAELRAGTEFAIVARRYSEDPATREQGGDLGWVRRSQVDPAFAEAAWRARPGQPVGPVKTRFGYHIIQVQNVRGGERSLRHILIRPRIAEEDVRRGHELAAALVDSVRAGAEISALAERHGIPGVPVRLPEVPVAEIGERFSPVYAEALADPIPGRVVGPLQVESFTPGRPAFAVLRITGFRAGGRYRLEDERERIRDALLFQKGFDRFLEELKDEIYVNLRLE